MYKKVIVFGLLLIFCQPIFAQSPLYIPEGLEPAITIQMEYVPVNLGNFVKVTPTPIPTLEPSPTEILLPSDTPMPTLVPEVITESEEASESAALADELRELQYVDSVDGRIAQIEEKIDKLSSIMESLLDFMKLMIPASNP